MKEKDIKTKPQGIRKAKAAPKTNPHRKNTASDIKSVAKDVLVRNVVKSKADKAKQNGQSDRAEVQAAENVETAAYTTVDTAYQKSKSFTENKLKQQRQRVKIRESQNTNIPHTPQNDFVSEVKNTPKQTHSVPKTKESYIRSQGKNPANLIKTPDRANAIPKQNTHTRTVSSNAKKAVKTKGGLSNGAGRAVKTGNSYE